jgi:hypothetical protein
MAAAYNMTCAGAIRAVTPVRTFDAQSKHASLYSLNVKANLPHRSVRVHVAAQRVRVRCLSALAHANALQRTPPAMPILNESQRLADLSCSLFILAS